MNKTLDIRRSLETLPLLGRGHARPWLAEALKLLAFATLYGWLALAARHDAAPHGHASLLLAPSGLALAALVIGGRRYAWGIALGMLISYLGTPQLSSPAIVGLVTGPALAALLSHWLLQRATGFDPQFKSLRDFLQLTLRGALLGGAIGALIGTASLVLAGGVPADAWAQIAMAWWMRDALGVLVVTPFVLIWWTGADLRIAAMAFDCQEGILIADRQRRVLRVNRAFTQMTGYAFDEVKGKVTGFARSKQHATEDYEAAWEQAARLGHWQGDRWLQRKNGELYFSRIGITAVRDEHGEITHFVGYSSDISQLHHIEKSRLRDETALRHALVQELNHRLKNSLQGVAGLLRRYPQQNPELTDLINQAVAQVHGVACVHGLQGSAASPSVGLCELTRTIAGQVQTLWQSPIALDAAARAEPFLVTEKEAVPVALVLNELIVNAAKHGGRNGTVAIVMDSPADSRSVCIAISNEDESTRDHGKQTARGMGLQLVSALMPRSGAELSSAQEGSRFVTRLTLRTPVVGISASALTTPTR